MEVSAADGSRGLWHMPSLEGKVLLGERPSPALTHADKLKLRKKTF
jgi:hypothetical protein